MEKKVYNLEERTYLFARDCRFLLKKLVRNTSNNEDVRQLVKSSGSIAANYIEANEKLGDKDFIFRLKISRKEAKESILWLRLLRDMNQEFTTEFEKMIQECDELRKILSAIINKA
ncbi:four helix bundle protein [Polaribacter sp. Z014]|uniref:four helix bundle protein n=1 Tax=Polaribacter sp. Z014 TaxID=2927126 RepID=UPI002020AADE|nr:four helix bundle protein [Polaribacter sp. Z014]